MKQCWDADPSKRPDIVTLAKTMRKIYESITNESSPKINNNLEANKTDSPKTNYAVNESFISKIYQFENLPEPRNATESIYYYFLL
jgi:hypothetical protein